MKRLALGAATAVTAAAMIGGGAASARGGPTVKADNFDFSPKKVRISPGDKVKWKATEGSHTVTFKGGFNEVISSGESTSRKFKKSGTFKYVCTFHTAQGMKGKVIVG